MNLARQKKFHLLLLGIAILALVGSVVAQQAPPQQNDQKASANPLVRVLQAKGILTEEEAAMIAGASSPAESEQRLAKLLLSKGIITQADYEQTMGASLVMASSNGASGAHMVPAVLREPVYTAKGATNQGAAAPKPAGPAVIPAVAPIRVFPIDPPKREGVIPAFKLGPILTRPYGFFKSTVIYDSSSPRGNDFPLPGFLGDTGPDASPEFHIKIRALRVGSNFEWLDPSPRVTVTGRFEMDFEGNFTRADNVNISSIRNSQPRIRLAWGRVDYAATENTTIHALFGQDWSPFASSTLPNLLETTGAGIAFGTLYTRQPQARFGFTHNFGGSANFKVQPEVAIALPGYGILPTNALLASCPAPGTTTFTCSVVPAPGVVGGVGVDNQLAYGERQGADSAQPEVQGRLAFQFQLDHAQGVPPAQIIFSGVHGRRRATVLAAGVPAAFKGAGSPFTSGARVESSRWGATAEIQLPTRYATIVAKYWNGEDLRWFFAGELFSNFNDTAGLFHVVSGACVAGTDPAFSVDASSTVAFGFKDAACTTPAVAPQRPVRATGGFVNVALPLSRIAGADPNGRNSGWTLYAHYGIDQAKGRDVRRMSAAGNRARSDMFAATLWYKLNSWVSFVGEQSYYRTRATQSSAGTFPLFRGIQARTEHDSRTEVGTVFTF